MTTLLLRCTRGLVVAASALVLTGGSAVPQAPPARPRLLVLLMVDQMRSDYMERYGGLVQAGLHRLAATVSSAR